MLTAMRDFEQAYEAYSEFQRGMERYWCLRWLIQESISVTLAEVIRENHVKVADIPLVVKVLGLPELPSGTVIELEISSIDLLALDFHCQFKVPLAATAH
jgi:exoribonuclease-2